MATYGALRLRIKQLLPEVNNEILDGWIQDIYTEILDLIPWKRQEAESVIQSPPSYAVGSINCTFMSNAVTGNGTNWTSDMNGLMIRISPLANAPTSELGPPGSGASEYYQFQYVSPTSATLDRPYEQTSNPIVTTTLGAGGSGYVVGDVFNIQAGNGLAQGVILQVDGSGAVTQYQMQTSGAGYSVASGVATVTSGNGTGLTINVTAVTPATNLPYRIDQNVFLLPSNCRIVRQVRPLHNRLAPLEIVQPDELNRISVDRNSYGVPIFACPTFDSFSDPPQMQIELFPVPAAPDSTGALQSWVVMYDFDASPIDAIQTSASLLPWVRPSALIAGVRMKAAEGKDQAAWQMHKTSFENLTKQILMQNSYQRGPQTIQLKNQFKRQNKPQYRRGPWHQGYPG